MIPGALSDPPLRPSYVLSGAQSVCYLPDSLRLKDYCAEPHSATSDHTDGPSEPHELTTQRLFSLWPQIEHPQCTCTARHHGQTPFHFTNRLLVFYFTEYTPIAQASRPLPSPNLSN
jgi:hypothetical protein